MSDVTSESNTAWLTDLRTLRRAAKQLETVLEMWVFMDTSLSMKIPRFQTHLTGCTTSQPTWSAMLGRRFCWRGDIHHNCSDFAVFSCRRFTFSTLMLGRHKWRCAAEEQKLHQEHRIRRSVCHPHKDVDADPFLRPVPSYTAW